MSRATRRWKNLDNEIQTLNRHIEALVRTTEPELIELHGVGIEFAAKFLVAAGVHANRVHAGDPSPNSAASHTLGCQSCGRSTGRHRFSRGVRSSASGTTRPPAATSSAALPKD